MGAIEPTSGDRKVAGEIHAYQSCLIALGKLVLVTSAVIVCLYVSSLISDAEIQLRLIVAVIALIIAFFKVVVACIYEIGAEDVAEPTATTSIGDAASDS